MKIHIIVTEYGTICGFYITPACESDVTALSKYELSIPSGSVLTADKDYNSYELEDLLKELDGILLNDFKKEKFFKTVRSINKKSY